MHVFDTGTVNHSGTFSRSPRKHPPRWPPAQAFREALASAGRGSRAYGLSPLNEAEAARLLVAMGCSLNHAAMGDAGAPGGIAPATALGPVFDALSTAVGRAPLYAGGRVLIPGNSGPGDNWRPDVVAQVLRDDHPQLDFGRLVAALDFPEATFASPHTFQLVVAVVINASGGFPTAELLRKPWGNARAQVDALRHAVQVCSQVEGALTRAQRTTFLSHRPSLSRRPRRCWRSSTQRQTPAACSSPLQAPPTASGRPTARGARQTSTAC